MSSSTRKSEVIAEVTREVKDRIRSLGLVSSGKMLNDVRVVLDMTPDGFSTTISSTDYFPILDQKYDITNYVLKNTKVVDSMAELFADLMIEELSKK